MTFGRFINRLNQRDIPLLPHFPKYLKVIFIVTFTVFSFLIVKQILAQSNDNNIIFQKQNAIQMGNNQEAWLDEALKGNSVSLLNMTSGTIPESVFSGSTGAINWVPGGMLGTTNQIIASLYNPQASGIEYIAQIKDNFLGKPAYAQGVGFKGLEPILPLWRAFRNIVYVLFSLIFIVIGIMIMLRIKVNPQTVISVQNAIPSLITALILVTFSYAIAGLLIDLSQLIQGLVVAMLFNATGTGFNQPLFSPNATNFAQISSRGMGLIADLTARAAPFWSIALWGAILGAVIGTFFGPGLGTLAGGGIAFVVVAIVFAIMMLIWMFKFYFGALKCYITIIFKIIIGPLEIAMGAFPGSKMNFSTWLWDLVANLAVFPVSIIFLCIANLIIDQTVHSNAGLWAPSIISTLSLQSAIVYAFTTGSLISVGIGLSTIALLSKLPEMIPQYIFMIKPSPWGTAIGEGLDMSKTPIIGGAIRGTQKEIEEKAGGQILRTGSELAGQIPSRAADIYNKWKTKNKHPQDEEDNDDHGEDINA